ncbi:MAG: hypothetical protein JWL72_3069, partial [Ilumatobacteraceae bacterium]|nr:hypothetical protein [Ilumatobacteraceae bacterium]
MSTRPRTVTGLSEALQRFDLLVASLTPEQWAAPSLCPDWTVRDVVAHVGSMEQELLAWRGADPPLLARLAHAIDDWRSAPPAVRSGRLRDVVHARVTELAAMTDDDFEAVGDMPTGRSSYGRFMEA